MSLHEKSKGNPEWVKGRSGNPNGRPKNAKSLKTILKVVPTLADKKRNPVEELIRIADKAEKAEGAFIVVDPGCTSWKVGKIVSSAELEITNNAIPADKKKPQVKVIPGSEGGRELAAKIWQDLLRYCEPQKKAQEVAPEAPRTPEESKAAAEEQARLIKELEDGANGETESSDPSGLAVGSSSVSPEASSEEDLRGNQSQPGTDLRSELLPSNREELHDGDDSDGDSATDA